VVSAVEAEGCLPASERAVDDLHVLAKPRRSLGGRPVRGTRLVVVESLDALSDRELEPAVREVVDRGGGLGQDRRPAQDRVCDQGSDSDRSGLERHRDKRAPAVEPGMGGVARVAGVIGYEEEVEPEFLDVPPALAENREGRVLKYEDAEPQLG
jgi:hypothetical protein